MNSCVSPVCLTVCLFDLSARRAENTLASCRSRDRACLQTDQDKILARLTSIRWAGRIRLKLLPKSILPTQVHIVGKALGCPVSAVTPSALKMEYEAAAGREEDGVEGAVANGSAGGGSDGTVENGISGGGSGSTVANGALKKQTQPRRQQDDGQREFFALSNTKDNYSLQGLVRSGGYLWIGKFGLPPAPPGEDEAGVRKEKRKAAGGR